MCLQYSQANEEHCAEFSFKKLQLFSPSFDIVPTERQLIINNKNKSARGYIYFNERKMGEGGNDCLVDAKRAASCQKVLEPLMLRQNQQCHMTQHINILF
jgi:hypothetical protein